MQGIVYSGLKFKKNHRRGVRATIKKTSIRHSCVAHGWHTTRIYSRLLLRRFIVLHRRRYDVDGGPVDPPKTVPLSAVLVRSVTVASRTMAPRGPHAQHPSAKLHLVPAEQLLTQHCESALPQCTYIVSPAVAANMDFPAAPFTSLHGLLSAQSYVDVSTTGGVRQQDT